MNKHKAYVKLLQDLVKIDSDAVLYLLGLSKQDKIDIAFSYGDILGEMFVFANTAQGQDYWHDMEWKVIKPQSIKKVKPLGHVEHQTPNTMKSLFEMFPSTPGSAALTGCIPIAYFNMHEKEIRAAMALLRRSGCGDMRTVYRGPRTNPSSNSTLRKDAHSVVIY